MVDLDNCGVTSIFYFWSSHSGYLDNGENVNKRFSIRLSLLYSSPRYLPSVVFYFLNISPTKENINEGNVANYPRMIRSLGNRLCGCIELGIGTPQRSIPLLPPWYVIISWFHQTSNFLCKSTTDRGYWLFGDDHAFGKRPNENRRATHVRKTSRSRVRISSRWNTNRSPIKHWLTKHDRVELLSG